MNCMYRIWSSRTLYVRDHDRARPLPLPIDAELRQFARRAMQLLELDILKELDKCLNQQKVLIADERLALWAGMWQLLHIYGDLLNSRISASAVNRERNARCRDLTVELLIALAVFYGGLFRAKAHIEQVSAECVSEQLQRSDLRGDLRRCFADTKLSRDGFCKCTDISVSLWLAP
jgi:hypothetical protein